ncbi:MAG: hypothetical protein CMF25_00170 [Kangiellaceae bacterium]|nr:hypothetical protein [Kangiellaceae bacterium]
MRLLKKISDFSLFTALLGMALVTSTLADTLCEAEGNSRCWYTTPDGTGNGSIDNPGRLETLIPQLAAGDFLYLLDGVYSHYYQNNGTDYIININKYTNFSDPQPTTLQPITIKAYTPRGAIIRGDLARGCILVDGVSHVIFDGLVVEDCFNKGMRIGWDVPEQDIRLTNMEFRNIEYFDDSGFLYIHSYDNVVIEDSEFHDYIPKASTGQLGSYIKFYQATDVTVRRNHFYGQGSGIYYKHGEASTGAGGYTRIYDKRFEALAGHGVSLNQNRSEVYNNLFIDNQGVLVHQEDGTRPPFTHDVHIHHNSFIRSQIYLRSGSNDGSYFDAVGLGAKNTTVNNNLLWDSRYRIWPYGSDIQYGEGVSLVSDSNCYTDTTDSMLFDFFSATNFGAQGGLYNLTEWQAQGYDVQSLEKVVALDSNYQALATDACAHTGWQAPVPAFTILDRNADNRSDISWHNKSTGKTWLYLMSGSTIAQSIASYTVSPEWGAWAGDFNGDGMTDTLWRNSQTGALYIYLHSGHQAISGAALPTVPLNWTIRAIADFNGDHQADILWHNNTTGQVWLYQMAGTSIAASMPVTNVDTPAWQIVAAGDLTGDGNADILWRHNDGTLWQYQMNGAKIKASKLVIKADPAWKVVGIGTVDSGNASIVWRHAVGGQNWLYIVNQGSITSHGPINTVADNKWHIQQLGDFDGDGNSDLLWRHQNTGNNAIYFLQGYNIQNIDALAPVDLDWQIIN